MKNRGFMDPERELFEKWAREAKWPGGGRIMSDKDLEWDKKENHLGFFWADVAFQAFKAALKIKE